MEKSLYFIITDNDTVIAESTNELDMKCQMAEYVNKLIATNFNTRLVLFGVGDFLMLCVDGEYHTVKIGLELK